MDRLQSMSTFVAVAENGGFAPAARLLNLSPPSVTRAVSELEARIGTRLLHRTTRSVRLTEAGERYLADCRRILSEIESAEQQAAGLHSKPSGSVTITASLLFGRLVLSPVLVDLLESFPEIAVHGVFADRVVHMYEDGIDVAVRIAALPDSTLTALRVGSVRTALVAAPDYLDRHGRPRGLDDLADHSLIDFMNLGGRGEWSFHSDGKPVAYTPSSRLRVNNGDVAIAAARRGFGITRVLSYMVHDAVASGALEVVLPDREPPPTPVHIVHKEAGQVSARVRAVVDHLAQGLRRHPALA